MHGEHDVPGRPTADERRLRVIAPVGYPWTFNGPRTSRHEIRRERFVPFNWINYRIEGITAFNPLETAKADLIHAFNRIPLGTKPFVIGFESHLPRAFGIEKTFYFRSLRRALASDRCRAIMAISDYARNLFRLQHADSPEWPALEAKLAVRYPNLPMPSLPEEARTAFGAGPVKLLFVGAHFARKGGCVALRMAQLALERGIDLAVTVVSSLEMGGGIWTDPGRPAYYDKWRALLQLPNVHHRQALPNAEVLALMRAADFSILATFGDTFGFSALEAMANGCPVIATRQAALPEFIADGQSGILLDLECNTQGDWAFSKAKQREGKSFEDLFDTEVERMAQTALARIGHYLDDPQAYAALRTMARDTAVTRFGAEQAAREWDDLYARVV